MRCRSRRATILPVLTARLFRRRPGERRGPPSKRLAGGRSPLTNDRSGVVLRLAPGVTSVGPGTGR
jgi:hypothetical protein